MEFYVRTDLYEAGRTEDGEQYTAECYYIVAEAADGARWRDTFTYFGCEVLTDDEGFQHFRDVRDMMKERIAARLLRLEFQLNVAGTQFMRDWSEMPAAYGSAAFSNEEMVEWEKGLAS